MNKAIGGMENQVAPVHFLFEIIVKMLLTDFKNYPAIKFFIAFSKLKNEMATSFS